METLRTCVNCPLWTDKKSSWSNRWHWCSEVDLYTPADQDCVCGKKRNLYEDLEELKHWYLSGETHTIYPEDIPEYLDSKDSSEEDEDE